jgi:predicted esterase
VLSIDTNPWISAPLRPDLLPRIEALEAQRDEVEQAQRAVRGALAAAREEANSAAVERLAAQDARLLERLRATWSEIADLRRGAFQVCAASDVEPVAADIAARVDDVTAEHAYAAEAVLGYVHSRFPQLAAAPVAVIGFSAGALVAPAAAVLLEEEVDAVVLIGGGANYLAIGTRSEFSDGGLRLDCRGEPVPQPLMQALERAYLERTRLDPYVLAPHLRGQPVLLVRATHDAWVPADTGEALQQQLGDPDRLVHVGGHKTLFYFLPTQSTRIARWLERAVER